jgi:hypothetical protein
MDNNSTVQDLAQELYSYLARRFPVCCWSDEFVFFPQALEENTDYSVWDDLWTTCDGSVVDWVNPYVPVGWMLTANNHSVVF